jgi:hypothetical protein
MKRWALRGAIFSAKCFFQQEISTKKEVAPNELLN